jgi:hypothetical protein
VYCFLLDLLASDGDEDYDPLGDLLSSHDPHRNLPWCGVFHHSDRRLLAGLGLLLTTFYYDFLSWVSLRNTFHPLALLIINNYPSSSSSPYHLLSGLICRPPSDSMDWTLNNP